VLIEIIVGGRPEKFDSRYIIKYYNPNYCESNFFLIQFPFVPDKNKDRD